MKKQITFQITSEESGMTVTDFLKKKAGLTNAQIRSLKFRPDGIERNGTRTRVSTVLESGDILRLTLENEEAYRGHLVPCDGNVEVMYEDEDVICVWKRSGIAVHPSGMHYQDTLTNQLQAYFEQKKEQVTVRSIGRLDLDTAGIVVFAKNRIAAQRLWRQKEGGEFIKEYIAFAEGSFERSSYLQRTLIEKPLGRMKDETGREEDEYRVCVRPDGKEAHTEYLALEEETGEDGTVLTKLRVWIRTGRMHQIRAHLAAEGHPLAGDPLYGHGIRGTDHAQLYADHVRFTQPFTGETVEICADQKKWGSTIKKT